MSELRKKAKFLPNAPQRGGGAGKEQDRDYSDYGRQQGFAAPPERRDVRGQDWSGYDAWQEFN